MDDFVAERSVPFCSESARLSIIPTVIMIALSVMIFEVAVSIVVGVVIVLNTATTTLPVTRIIAFAIVMWCNPTRSLIRRSSPIPFMPFVMFSGRIPIALYPHESDTRGWRGTHNNPGWRWRPNHDSHRNLRLTRPGCG